MIIRWLIMVPILKAHLIATVGVQELMCLAAATAKKARMEQPAADVEIGWPMLAVYS